MQEHLNQNTTKEKHHVTKMIKVEHWLKSLQRIDGKQFTLLWLLDLSPKVRMNFILDIIWT